MKAKRLATLLNMCVTAGVAYAAHTGWLVAIDVWAAVGVVIGAIVLVTS